MKLTFILLIVLLINIPLLAQKKTIKPVTPHASKEVVALLEYLQSISGKHTLSGQHNFPISGARNTEFAGDYIGETPIIWSQDFGFSEKGDKDSYLSRPAIVQEAIRQHKKGAIVNLCWHAVPPTANEPVTFQPLSGYDSTRLASVQGNLLDQQFEDLLTPGTEIYKHWIKQVDEIASYLKQLEDANVPVLWRPYHEMNGDWFWWGGRYEGKYKTARLYKQIFDRLVKHHKLKNLIWVWSVDRPSQPGREFENYYPGNKYLDILAIDIYGNDFSMEYYDGLMKLSEGKPITLGEVGTPPTPEILDEQPNWLYWVVWSGMVRGTSKSDYEKLVQNPRPLFMEDSVYIKGMNEVRQVFGFDPLPLYKQADFTGEWIMNDCESDIQAGSLESTPYKLKIKQDENKLMIQTATVSEWSDDQIGEEVLTLDGKDITSTGFRGAPRLQHANWSQYRNILTIDSTIKINLGGRESKIKGVDTWSLKSRGTQLIIDKEISSFTGTRHSLLVYDRRKD